MRYVLLGCLALSVIGRQLVVFLLDRIETNFYWATKGSKPHDAVIARHTSEVRRYEDIRVGLTYISFSFGVLFALAIALEV